VGEVAVLRVTATPFDRRVAATYNVEAHSTEAAVFMPHDQLHPCCPTETVLRRRRTKRLGSLSAIVALGLMLRVWGADMGLPDIWHPDAHQYVAAAWLMSLDSLNPHEQLPRLTNTHLYIYLLLLLKGVISLWHAMLGSPHTLQDFVGSGGPVLAARTMGAVFGALSVAVIYRIGAVLLGRSVGMSAAALLATNFFTIRNAHFAMPDVTMIFALLVSMERSAVYLRSGSPRQLWLAAAMAGVTTAIKLTGGVAVLCPLTALLLRRSADGRRLAARRSGVVVAIFAAATLLLSPYTVLDSRPFTDIHDVVFADGAKRGTVQETDPVWLLHHRHYVVGLGWAAYQLSFLGAAVLIWRRPRVAAALLAAPAAYLLVHLNLRLCYARYTLPPVPFMLLAAAWAAHWLSGRFPARRRVLIAIVAIACLGPLARSMRFDWICTQDDTRVLARRWIQEHVPRDAVFMVEGLFPPVRTHPYCVYARGQTQTLIPFVRPAYFVSDMTVRQFLCTHEIYGSEYQRNYENIDTAFRKLAEFSPTDDDHPLLYHSSHVNAPMACLWRIVRPGPHLRVYEVAEPERKQMAEVTVLRRPLGRTDWQYIARVGNFPLGMLTRAWMGDGPVAGMVRDEFQRLVPDWCYR